ncbi:hypothetical protein BKA65DRAFT_514737 [Rhexocercosporidium sp. MPI-PUGE-AT-0058]|nr:hypothetical protein BKA65DRAFT_514737 [Rhexocercosporidium sp. MPI-PUGE-AT-0058]
MRYLCHCLLLRGFPPLIPNSVILFSFVLFFRSAGSMSPPLDTRSTIRTNLGLPQNPDKSTLHYGRDTCDSYANVEAVLQV